MESAHNNVVNLFLSTFFAYSLERNDAVEQIIMLQLTFMFWPNEKRAFYASIQYVEKCNRQIVEIMICICH